MTPWFLEIAGSGGAPWAASALDGLAIGLLFVAIIGAATHRLDRGVWLVGAQSVLLTVIALVVALETGAPHVYAAAALTFVVKVAVIPLVLFRALNGLGLRHESEPVVTRRIGALIIAGLIVLGYHTAGTLEIASSIASRHVLPVSLTLMLLGLFLMVARRTVFSQILGLVAMENGVYLAALVATSGLPIAVDLAVFFDVLVGVVLMSVLMMRINETHDSTSADRLRSLRY